MIRRATPVDETATLARLAEDLDRLTATVGRLTDLPQVVTSHSRALTDLGDVVARLSATVPPKQGRPGAGGTARPLSGPGAPDDPGNGHSIGDGDDDPHAGPAAPAWLTVTDPRIAVGWLGELAVWVPRVWQPYLQTRTPACWPWHPAVTAELLVVQHLWDEAVTSDEPGPGPLAAWHDRWRPGAAARITRLMAGCERAHGRHKAAGKEYFYDTAYLDEVAHWWATTHGSDPTQPAPGLALDRDGR